MTQPTPVPHEDALSKAKIGLMSKPDSVFYTTVAFSLRHKFDDSLPTAATNGRQIRYNPTFFMSLSPDERIFLMLHEAMHCAYLHMARLQERDPNRWNIACDYVINLQLVERGFKMPAIGLLDEQYKGLSAEEVYALLPSNPAPPAMPDLEPHEGDAAATEALQQEIQDILVRAALQAKMAGDSPASIPGDIQVALDKLLNPKLPWHAILRKYLSAYAKNDYSFRKPNRRFFPAHYLPSLYSDSLQNLDIAVDASGSVTDDEFSRFISETFAILRMLRPQQIRVVTFDTAVRSVDTVRNAQQLRKLTFTGRGGTQIAPVIEWANTNQSSLLLVFSDGEFRIPPITPAMPVVWVIHNRPSFTAPCGKVIHYEM